MDETMFPGQRPAIGVRAIVDGRDSLRPAHTGPARTLARQVCELLRRTVRHPLGLAACFLVIAGGVGNILDRVRLGYVVDMFHFEFWPSYPVFNVADICIVCGAVLGVIYYLWLYEKYDKRERRHG